MNLEEACSSAHVCTRDVASFSHPTASLGRTLQVETINIIRVQPGLLPFSSLHLSHPLLVSELPALQPNELLALDKPRSGAILERGLELVYLGFGC